MKLFTELFRKIDGTTSTTAKTKALVQFFEKAEDRDKIWAIALFTHKRPKRSVSTGLLRTWAAKEASVSDWLFDECYQMVGDLAETIALLLPIGSADKKNTLDQWVRYIDDLRDQTEELKEKSVLTAWRSLGQEERFLFNKIITGGFRMGVSDRTITKALSKNLSINENTIAHRLMGNWDPFTVSFSELLLEANENESNSKPYPFYLAYALDKEIDLLGTPEDWMAEWKWDGIRSQLILRNQEVFLWSRGQELINQSFPEFEILKEFEGSSFVIDGELIVRTEDGIQDFNVLQKRLGRKKPGKKTLKDHPAHIIAYDLLELEGEDLRHLPQGERRIKLEKLFTAFPEQFPLSISPLLNFKSWEELAELRSMAREKKSEGLMLKSVEGTYKTSRKKGDWWKWKLDPYTIDAVMIYAQRGHGRRTSLFTDFTFAVWKGDQLVPFTKAYTGLTDVEFQEITRFVKKNTLERFGPVSSVKAELVFEIAFEGIAKSKRHKSGVALRFPRIKRWRKDKQASEANKIEDLMFLL